MNATSISRMSRDIISAIAALIAVSALSLAPRAFAQSGHRRRGQVCCRPAAVRR